MNSLLKHSALAAALWTAGGLSPAAVSAGADWFKHGGEAKVVKTAKRAPAAPQLQAQATENDERAARLAALMPALPTATPAPSRRLPVQVSPTPLSASTSDTDLLPTARRRATAPVAARNTSFEDTAGQCPDDSCSLDGCGGDSCVPGGDGCTSDGCAPGDDGFLTVTDGDSCAGDSCGSAGCTACRSGCGDCWAPGFWKHRTGGFGEFLYLHPTGGDVSFVQIRDGAVPLGSVPMGPVTRTDPDYSPGFRAGFAIANTPCSSWRGSYTHFESRSVEATATNAPFALHSLVTYPNTINAFAPSLQARANHDVDFQMADAAYHAVLCHDRCTVVNYSVGARYGQIDQTILAQQPITPGTTSVFSEVNFQGGGVRVGLDGERHACKSGFYIYGNVFASALAGRLRADYLQSNTFGLTQAMTSWRDDRIVPVLEYELGLGWQTRGGGLKLRAGYYVAAWYNMVPLDTYINAVRSDNYVSVDDVLTFDGLVARAEINF